MTRLRICRLGIFFLFYLGAMMAAPAQDMVFRSMYNFNGSDGSQPEAKLVQATDGNFYGTTMMGGAGGRGACNGSCGTIFKITPAGVWIMLHSFDGFSGSGPYAGLVQAADGYFYGTTIKGGASVTWGSSGFGSVFKISPLRAHSPRYIASMATTAPHLTPGCCSPATATSTGQPSWAGPAAIAAVAVARSSKSPRAVRCSRCIASMARTAPTLTGR